MKSFTIYSPIFIILILSIIAFVAGNEIGVFYFKWWIVVLTVLLVLINPVLEEAYWRGLLIDQTREWSSWIGPSYSSVLLR